MAGPMVATIIFLAAVSAVGLLYAYRRKHD